MMVVLYAFFFVVMYFAGWSLIYVPVDYLMLYVFGVFLVLNIFTILNQKLYAMAIIKPLQLSNASILIYSFLNDSYIYALVASMLFVSFVVLEWEDFNYVKKDKNKERVGFYKTFNYIMMFGMLPFSVTYSVMIFRPYEEMFNPVVMILYFTILFFSAKYLLNMKAIVIFVITQCIGFVYLIDKYYNMGPMEIIIFVFAVFGFLLINNGRKGLLEYLEK